MHIVDTNTAFRENADGLYVAQSQVIPDSFLEELKSERMAKENVRAGEMHKVASVPALVVEIWAKQGWDINKMTAREVVRKLREDGMEAFVATPKRV